MPGELAGSLPLLVIGGEADIFTPPWMAEEVARGIPRRELHLYKVRATLSIGSASTTSIPGCAIGWRRTDSGRVWPSKPLHSSS